MDYAALEQKLLALIDNKTEDGILSLGVLRRNGIRFTDKVNECIRLMICKGVLVERDSTNFSAERPGNTRSKWGFQKNFDQYIHLTKADMEKAAAEDVLHAGLKLLILDDINVCVYSRYVETESDGIAFFSKNYTAPYSYCFVKIQKGET